MPFCCYGKPFLKIYISFGLDDFFYLCGLEPVAPRARFKCVWVFKDFSAEKPFGLQPHRHTSATELCHFRFLSHHWNQRKVQKRSKKHKTKADENGPDWIMSDLAWGKSSFCLITLCLTAKWFFFFLNGNVPLCSLENNRQIVTVNTGLKWCGLCMISSHKAGRERRGKITLYNFPNFGAIDCSFMLIYEAFSFLRREKKLAPKILCYS